MWRWRQTTWREARIMARATPSFSKQGLTFSLKFCMILEFCVLIVQRIEQVPPKDSDTLTPDFDRKSCGEFNSSQE